MPNCVICNREVSKGSFSLKDKFELTGGGFICKTCAQKIGIKNFMAAGAYTAQKARKKYYDMYPNEAQGNSTPSAEDEAKLDEQFIAKFNAIPDCEPRNDSILRNLRRALDEGEEVLHAVMGYLSDDSVLLAISKSSHNVWFAALTNTRVVLVNQHITGTDRVSFPLETVNSVSCGSGIVDSVVTISQGMSCVILKNIRNKYAKAFTDKANEAIRNIRSKQVQEPKATPVSAADELAKWYGLLQQGIITQEEFDAQKAKLLR